MRFQRELASEERQYRDHRHAHRSPCDYIGKIPCDVISNQSLVPYWPTRQENSFSGRWRTMSGWITIAGHAWFRNLVAILRHCFQTPWFFSFLDNMLHLKMYANIFSRFASQFVTRSWWQAAEFYLRSDSQFFTVLWQIRIVSWTLFEAWNLRTFSRFFTIWIRFTNLASFGCLGSLATRNINIRWKPRRRTVEINTSTIGRF